MVSLIRKKTNPQTKTPVTYLDRRSQIGATTDCYQPSPKRLITKNLSGRRRTKKPSGQTTETTDEEEQREEEGEDEDEEVKRKAMSKENMPKIKT